MRRLRSGRTLASIDCPRRSRKKVGDKVVTAALLERTRDYFRRYVVVEEPVPTVVACWVAHTYAASLLPVTPYLHFHSPEPGSGKTTALDVLESVSCEGVRMDGVTAAVLFRVIDMLSPTLLLDEVDVIFGPKPSEQSEAIRAS